MSQGLYVPNLKALGAPKKQAASCKGEGFKRVKLRKEGLKGLEKFEVGKVRSWKSSKLEKFEVTKVHKHAYKQEGI